ncbi:conjugative transposon protein TraK [Paraflavisolibacter sp. H34]|uniref:conjugative transposon protein TraK n=1 Tax=Huijunlia imazamoxiresistens TaxID=3127457 RepID=UPI00301A91DB
MFQKMKNIDTAFRYIRAFSLFFLLACILVSGYALYLGHEFKIQAEQRIYILAGGKVLEAYSSGRRDNLPVEARDHVRMFHQHFFTLDPDDKVITANITRALYLADGSARRQYKSLKENGYYAEVVAANISQEISIDSVAVNMTNEPYYFRCYATQKITRPSSITMRSLVTEGYLRGVSRSDNNPHGFLIERWATLENKDLKTQNR